MGEKEKGFKSFVPEEYEQDKRRAYESLLGIADALSSGSSDDEEGLGQGNNTLEVRRQHAPIAHEKHRRKKRRRREKSSSSERKWIRKERQRLIEAEKMAGPGTRLRQALVLRDESDLTNFVEDYKGDLGNIAFERMLDSDVPRYRRNSLKVKGRDSSAAKKVGMNQNDGWRRWIDKHDAIESKPCDIKSSHSVTDSVDAFIPIASKEETDGFPEGDYQGHLIERTREFNTKTRDHPHDIQIWLEFAAFQTETADILRSAGVHVSKQSYWEKRLEVLERALQCNPGSDVLALEMLKIAEKVKTRDEVNRLWRTALMSATAGASSVSLWESFLHRQRKHENFNAIVVSKCYLAAVTTFRRECDKEGDLVSILIECIRFHLECGFIGMGIAMIQVLLECNLFYPEEVDDQDLEECFEKFWDSSCPLIGSKNAPGWNRWYRSGCDISESSHKTDRNDDETYFDDDNDSIGIEFDKKADKLENEPSFEDIERWLTMEMSKDSNTASSHPTSSKVAWEDIRPFAVKLKDSHSIMTILAKCMGYLGLHHVSFMQHAQVCQEQSDLSLFEVYCTPKMFRLLSYHDTILDGFSGEGKNTLHGPWWAQSPERQEFVVRLLTDIAGKLQGPLRGILMDMSIKIQLYDATTGLFCETRSQKALSFAKLVLSQQYDGTLSLWGEYAFLSFLDSGGTSKVANKIFKKCMSQKRSDDDLYDAARLCHAHAKCQLLRQGLKWSILGSEFMYPACTAYMDRDHANKSIKAFLWFAGQIHQADMRQAIVQSRRVFQGLIPQCMDNHTKLAALIQTFVAFEIISGIVEDGYPHLDHALSIMHHVMMDLERKRILEIEKPTTQDPMSLHILAVQQCVLASITCEISPLALSPAEAREMVLHMLEVWPGSPLLLTSLSMMEERFNNINTLRRELRLLATQSAVQLHEHMSLIALEEPSPFPKARIVFEKALQQEPCRTCPIIWRLYMRKASFEYSHSTADIFFRAVDACPWSKSVWMEGISLMTRSTAYPTKSLVETIQALREKDIPWSTEVYEILL